MPYITLDTYSDLFLENHEENPNYDKEIRLFTVPYAWLSEEYKADNLGQFDLDYFLINEYTWDESWWLYERATADKVIIDERIIRR